MHIQSLRSLLPDCFRLAARNAVYRRRYRGLAIGRDTRIINSRFGDYVDLADEIMVADSGIGDYTYVGKRTEVWSGAIGKFCSIGPDCFIGLGAHPIRAEVSSHPAFYLRRPSRFWTFAETDRVESHSGTQIGNDVWIGWRVGIRSGVQIGDGAVIGAGAIVLHDIPPYAVAVGTPARIIRYRFSDPEIAFLLSVRWWDRDPDWLRQHIRCFSDIALFMKEAGRAAEQA